MAHFTDGTPTPTESTAPAMPAQPARPSDQARLKAGSAADAAVLFPTALNVAAPAASAQNVIRTSSFMTRATTRSSLPAWSAPRAPANISPAPALTAPESVETALPPSQAALNAGMTLHNASFALQISIFSAPTLITPRTRHALTAPHSPITSLLEETRATAFADPATLDSLTVLPATPKNV